MANNRVFAQHPPTLDRLWWLAMKAQGHHAANPCDETAKEVEASHEAYEFEKHRHQRDQQEN